MRKTLIFLILSFCIFKLYANEIPNFISYKMEKTFWTKSENQILYWENGNVKLDYELINDSIKVRREYFENSQLKLTCEIVQRLTIDFEFVEDLETGEIVESEIQGYRDLPCGLYTEYFVGYDSKIKAQGNLQNQKKVGEWFSIGGYFGSDNLVKVLSFDVQGNPVGQFLEYYDSGRKKVKCKGQFSFVYLGVGYTENVETGDLVEIPMFDWCKDGKWEFFERNGSLIKEINYKYFEESN